MGVLQVREYSDANINSPQQNAVQTTLFWHLLEHLLEQAHFWNGLFKIRTLHLKISNLMKPILKKKH